MEGILTSHLEGKLLPVFREVVAGLSASTPDSAPPLSNAYARMIFTNMGNSKDVRGDIFAFHAGDGFHTENLAMHLPRLNLAPSFAIPNYMNLTSVTVAQLKQLPFTLRETFEPLAANEGIFVELIATLLRQKTADIISCSYQSVIESRNNGPRVTTILVPKKELLFPI